MQTGAETSPGFYVAAFVVDGELEGIDLWPFARLSPKWLDLSEQFLAHYGDAFTASWGGSLARVKTRFTSSQGVALVTFSVDDRLAASLLLASGAAPAAEADIFRMFVDSLRSVSRVAESASSKEPFGQVLAIQERPAMIVVPWPDDIIEKTDHDIVRELALHVAGAFFRRTAAARNIKDAAS